MSCTMVINIISQETTSIFNYSQSNKTTGKIKLLNDVGEIVDYSNFL